MAEKPINLALQGGGSHGAFTWGVLDRLLEEPGFEIEGISGTSAGAINAAVLADGYEKGGAEGAREALGVFWRRIADHAAFSPFRNDLWNVKAFGPSPAAVWMDWLLRWLSPYQFNPLDYNPLRQVLVESIDFETLRCCRSMQLFISATNVRTNRLHIFTADRLSPDVLLASACLPQFYQAVAIGDEYFWDGGYMGNPVLEPLVSHCQSRDILIVQVNPKRRETVPTNSRDIDDRINEITFNASLMREIRSIAHVTRMLDDMGITGHDYEKAYFHMIDGEDYLSGQSALSKLDAQWTFVSQLFEWGRERAGQWLEQYGGCIGQGSTLDLDTWVPPYE